jgi:hypothetical protein
VANARFDDYIIEMTATTVNAHKSNRRSLTMLAALVAIALLADSLGLAIHYGFAFRHDIANGIPVAHELTATSSQIR